MARMRTATPRNRYPLSQNRRLPPGACAMRASLTQILLPAHVGAKARGNLHAARGRLVHFEDAGHDARQRETGAIERVNELEAVIALLQTNFGATRLEVFKVGAGRNFEPLADAGRERFQV